jgi:hypothetical protein
MGVVLPASLFRACVAALLVACASHDTTPTASGDGTATGVSPQLPETGEYPPGPFGLNVGDVFPRVKLLGYHAGQSPWTTVDAKDYFDPHGLRGINGVYITVSAPWCSGCKLEGQELPTLWTSQYKARGARIVTVLLQGAAYEPASQATADAWIAAYRTPYDLAVGDVATMLPPKAGTTGGVGLPYNYAVDPRTMRIMSIDSGDYFHGDALPGLDSILAKNVK